MANLKQKIQNIKAKQKAGTGDAARQDARLAELKSRMGVRQDAQAGNEKAQGGGKGMLSKPPRIEKNPYLNRQQNRVVNQQRQTDINLGQAAQDQFETAAETFETPMDWGQYSDVQGPDYGSIAPRLNTGDWNDWRQQQIDASSQDFERQFGQVFAREKQDLEQTLANRGIPMGSELYNQQMQQLNEQQQGQRQSNLVQAMNLGASNASQFGNLAMQARGQGFQEEQSMYGQSLAERQRQISEGMQQRYQPMTEGNMLRAAQSPLMMSDAQYANQAALQQQQADAAMQMKYFGRAAGAAGGYNGTGMSYPEYAALNTANAMALQQSNPAYQQGSSPSPWWNLAGNAAGIIAGAAADYYF